MKLYYALHQDHNDLHYYDTSAEGIERQHRQFPEYRDFYGKTLFVEVEDIGEAARFVSELVMS